MQRRMTLLIQVEGMNLIESVRQWVLSNLPYDKSDTALATYLNGLDAHGLLVRYHNWMSRLIYPTPRRVHQSATFIAAAAKSPHKAAIEHIVDDIENGRDLRKYLSKGIETSVQLPQPGKSLARRRDLDLLLTTWEIHHLHLSTIDAGNGFVTRTGDLLFGVFRRNDAYLVDIVGHGGWYQDDLLRILMNELPGSNVVQELRGVVGLSHEPDEQDIKTMRNVGANMAHMIDGKAVFPAGAMTTAGTSMVATREADRLLERVKAFENEWNREQDAIRSEFAASGFPLPPMPEFEFLITEHGPGVYEPSVAAFYPLK